MKETVKKTEFREIDWLKLFCLLGVIVAHMSLIYIQPGENPYWKLYSPEHSAFFRGLSFVFVTFLIPGFVFASGFLFAFKQETAQRKPVSEIRNRAKRLLKPYYLWSILYLWPTYLLFDFPAHNRQGEAWTDLLRVVTGTFTDHLWFLWMLFWVSLAFILLRKIITQLPWWLGVALFAVIGYLSVTSADFQKWQWFCFAESPYFLLFFYVGMLFYRIRLSVEKLLLGEYRLSLFIGTFLLTLAAQYAGFLLPANTFLSYAISLVTVFFFYYIFLWIDRENKKLFSSSALRFLTKESFYIYLLHMPLLQLFLKLTECGAGIPPVVTVLLGTLFVTGSCICLILLGRWINAVIRKFNARKAG
ncbi:MAG: acyltransferase [Bacteroidales bacterium]|nr:acyltransferase [Bacteroidales bacterium]